jgi:hypothetical protein
MPSLRSWTLLENAALSAFLAPDDKELDVGAGIELNSKR